MIDAASAGCLVTEEGIEQMVEGGTTLPLPADSISGRYEQPGDWYNTSSGCLVPGDLNLWFVHCEVTAEGHESRADLDRAKIVEGTGPPPGLSNPVDWYRGSIFVDDAPLSRGSCVDGDVEADRARLETLLSS